MKQPGIQPLLALVLWVLPALPAAAGAAPAPEPIKAFCIDFNWGPGGINGFAKPGLWADADPEQHVAWYQALGCNVIQTFAVSCNGYAWYKGGIVPEQPGLKHDFLTEMVRLGHRRGMRVMGYLCVGANTRWGQEHPDLSYGTPSGMHIPFTTEYLDYLSAAIEDALKRTGMDGFMTDWMFNPQDGGQPFRWLPCEQRMYRELFGEPFPGADKVTPERKAEFLRRAVERCWGRIHGTAKRVKPDCVLWLSCHNVGSPTVAGSRLFREVDWLMNENPNRAGFDAVSKVIGPQTRLIQCCVGWGDAHDARRLTAEATAEGTGIYGFAAPTPNSLPLPIATYKDRPIGSFTGNDRNIAILARFFNGLPIDMTVRQEADGRVLLAPGTAEIVGSTPVVEQGQIGRWSSGKDYPQWTFALTKPGTFTVKLTYACQAGLAGSKLAVKVGDASLEHTSVETGPTWREYRTFTLGKVALAAGRHTLSVRPSPAAPWKAISLKSVELAPAAK